MPATNAAALSQIGKWALCAAYSKRVNGLLILDKPAGMTSHDVVNRVRRITGESSTGHLGTLDPMATGVLPLLLGKYTRLAQFFGSMEKSYTGTIRFGFSTDTYDAEGVATSEAVPVALTLAEIRDSGGGFFRGDGADSARVFGEEGCWCAFA